MGASLIDVGTDHGWLPILLTERQIVRKVIAADINEGPLASARANVAARGFGARIDVRLGSGLTVVQPGEVDTAVIAGMGGPLMVKILQDSPEVVAALDHLVLQPMIGAGRLRAYLDQLGWAITEETVFQDMGRDYVLLRADHAQSLDPYHPFRNHPAALEAAYEYGPLLLARPTANSVQWMTQNLQRLERTRLQLTRSSSVGAVEKQATLETRIEWLHAWLNDSRVHQQDVWM